MSNTGLYEFDKETKYHEGFVLDVIPEVTGNGFLSAGRDSKIFQVDLQGSPVQLFEGHEQAVNSLS